MKTINEWITEIHRNAVEHGWWDNQRDLSESLVLICSEWSEAIEEARKGRPNHYYVTMERICDQCFDETVDPVCEHGLCPHGSKPEGICVEMVDGVIRILDLLGAYEVYGEDSHVLADTFINVDNYSLCQIIHRLTKLTANVARIESKTISWLLECVGIVVGYCYLQGLDPEKIMAEKHAYNCNRQYKHGKRF